MFFKNRLFWWVFITFFGFWILISVFRTVYNFSKLFTEETKWFFLTDEQKKEKQFGDKHNFYRFVQKNVPSGSNILLFTSDGMVYYLSRYYLYPTTVIWGERQFIEWGDDINRNYDFVLFYPVNNRQFKNQIVVNSEIYKKAREYRKDNKLRGLIYKK